MKKLETDYGLVDFVLIGVGSVVGIVILWSERARLLPWANVQASDMGSLIVSILITALLVAAVAALIWLGLLLRRLLMLFGGAARAIQPINDDAMEESGSHLRDWLERGPRTVLDQLIAEMWLQRRGLRNMEDALNYIRGYLWEVRDPRFLRDLKGDLGLRRREQDYTHEFERDVAAPVRAKHQAAQNKSERDRAPDPQPGNHEAT